MLKKFKSMKQKTYCYV